jgi:putative MATE family efflux protein
LHRRTSTGKGKGQQGKDPVMAGQDQAKFLQGNLFGHVTVMALTGSVGLVAVFLVDFIDMVFISMLGVPELAAAVGFAGAILFFTTSFGIGMAIAAGALVARALGRGDAAAARRLTTNTMLYGIAAAAVFAAIVWAFLRPITALVGASGETQELAIGYLAIIVPSLPFLIVGMMGGAILRAHGDARRAMAATLAGSAVNLVLDPILIFGLGLELTGAALASVAARVTIAAVAVRPILRAYGGFEAPTLPGMARDLGPVFAIALPAILTQLATPVGSAYVIRAMAQFGEAAVAGMAIVLRLTPVAFAVVFALSGAIGPIIGQNAGAGDFARVRRAYTAGLIFAGLYTLFVTALLLALRGPLAGLFGAEGVARDLLFLFCGPLALAWFFNAAIFVSNAGLNNLGRPFWSTAVNWGRHTVGTVPFVAVFAAWLGAPGVLIGQAVGGVLFAGLAAALTLQAIGREERPEGPSPFQRAARQVRLYYERR